MMKIKFSKKFLRNENLCFAMSPSLHRELQEYEVARALFSSAFACRKMFALMIFI